MMQTPVWLDKDGCGAGVVPGPGSPCQWCNLSLTAVPALL